MNTESLEKIERKDVENYNPFSYGRMRKAVPKCISENISECIFIQR